MDAPPSPDITGLLREWSEGDGSALERLLPLVYDELRRLAGRNLRRERPGHTLQPTGLVHEAYLRLVDQHGVQWKERAQFFAVSARIMRRILVDHARRRDADKRGGGAIKQTLDDWIPQGSNEEVDVLALEEALQRLEAIDERQSRIVEMRFFAGLTVEEVAEVLDVSPATVKNDWRMARAWLYGELHGGDAP